MKLRHKQNGITLSGLIMGCIVLGSLALVGMKLWPVYNEKFKVDIAMDKLASTPEGNRMGRRSMAKVLQKQFDINDVAPVPEAQLAKKLQLSKKKGSKNKLVTLEYEIRSPLTEELDVVLKYNKTVEMGAEQTD